MAAKKDEQPIITPKSDRQARWDAYVENYMKANPVKGAHKKKAGNFDTIPDTFK